MKASYTIWSAGGVAYECTLGDLKGVDDQYGLNVGVARAASFPGGASFSMRPDNPHDLLLTDSLVNTDFVLVVSPRLQRFLEARGVESVEYLPVAIFDHKKKLAGEYFIVHPINPVDCLDVPACGATFWSVDPDNIMDVERLVIDVSKIPSTRELFRPASFFEVFLVRQELAEEIDAAGFTGITWIDIDGYPHE